MYMVGDINRNTIGNILAVHRLPRGSELIRSSEGLLKGAKMTVMDILEFRDINGPDPKCETWTNKVE